MNKLSVSARGEMVDFDLLAIKKQLSTNPVPVSVNARRKFVDEKDGAKSKLTSKIDALSLGIQGANISADSEDAPSDDKLNPKKHKNKK